MPQVHTHYDNLKIARNAPPEVIRAAYRVLSQKYHPDKHHGSADAHRVMKLVNEAYEVLSDPQKRRHHDEWIRQQEAEAPPAPPRPQPMQEPGAAPERPQRPQRPQREHAASSAWNAYDRSSSMRQPPAPEPRTADGEKGSLAGKLMALLWVLGATGAVFVFSPMGRPSRQPPDTTSSLAGTIPSPPPQRLPAYSPPLDSPARKNGSATIDFIPAPRAAKPDPYFSQAPEKPRTRDPDWPAGADYVPGLPFGAMGGLSSLTIDNSRNDSSVYVKLHSVESGTTVRHIYIPGGQSFTASSVAAGRYEVRYKDLVSREIAASEPFELHEDSTLDGTQYSNVTMTLYKVRNGNMHMHALPESDF